MSKLQIFRGYYSFCKIRKVDTYVTRSCSSNRNVARRPPRYHPHEELGPQLCMVVRIECGSGGAVTSVKVVVSPQSKHPYTLGCGQNGPRVHAEYAELFMGKMFLCSLVPTQSEWKYILLAVLLPPRQWKRCV